MTDNLDSLPTAPAAATSNRSRWITEPAPLRFRLIVAAILLACSTWLLFYQLGHYPLWADEADTALFARGIWETGDTTAIAGHNVYAFRGGMLLTNLHNRYTPPLAYYLVAPFWGSHGTDAGWLRTPFAACGWLCVLLLIVWLWQSQVSRLMWLLVAGSLLGDVSFFLFARQCRYYALATLASVAIVYLYLHPRRTTRHLVLLVMASLVLLATQYLNFLALYSGLAVDYLLWERHRKPLPWWQTLLVLAPQFVCGALLLLVWNPLGKGDDFFQVGDRDWLLDKGALLWWNLRDLNVCEFLAWLVLAAGSWLAWRRRDRWFLRGMVAFVVYVVAVTLASPQVVGITSIADVRYLAATIPLAVWLTARSLEAATLRWGRWAMPVACIVMLTNVANIPWSPRAWRSTPLEFIGEVLHPRETATAAMVHWLDAQVAAGQTALVLPASDAISLMAHAPHVVYGWQFDEPPAPQFAKLPDIQVVGRVPVDYILVFGADAKKTAEKIIHDIQRPDVSYRLVKTIDVYWSDQVRPEMFWHAFKTVTDFDRTSEAVYVYKLYLK